MTGSEARDPEGASLLPRIATALLLIPLALGSALAGGRVYASVIAAMTIFLIFEWTRMVDGAELRRGFYTLSATAALSCFFAAGGQPMLALWIALGGGAVATVLEWPKPNPQSWPMVGAVYIIVPAVAALWVNRDAVAGEMLTVLLFLCVWATDSGALLVGRTVGGPKLVPRISPRKTWAGAIGGVIASVLTAWAFGWLFRFDAADPLLALGLILGIATVLGDIAESALKRRYGMKDSGGAFPGHGGVLDRLDGFLFAVLALAGTLLLLQSVS
ncbi:phosphatidate cytidylyltransferase [Parvularcula sp. ZS-1/3]|uniref:Phosphatidate cytidylyltransferase n=1 Tax=Parvularcula mediterranea TaxID=2732508 RepID=A0A7Y3RM88_9PROT|nr:phosphatidate cytidylyltransferase [Parvularcula mediterranea]